MIFLADLKFESPKNSHPNPSEPPIVVIRRCPVHCGDGSLTAQKIAGPTHQHSDKERKQREESTFLAYRDETRRVTDFHALRHTFITNLARGGVHPKQAQDLARHSDINLTLSRYSHTVMGERAAALEALPDLSTRPEQERQRATGTDGKSLVPGLVSSLVERRTSKGSPVSSGGIETESDSGDLTGANPDECSTSDSSRHRMTRSVIEADDEWRGG